MPPWLKMCVFLCALSLCAVFPKVYADADVTVEIDKRVAALQEHFNIPVFYKGSDRQEESLRYEFLPPADYQALNRYLQLFEEEIRKYPAGFFSKKKIRGIALVRRLFRGETPTEGAYSPGLRVMLFDVLRSVKNESKQRHSIHHEIFHMMAFQPPGSEDLTPGNWAALNVAGFTYGKHNFARRATNPVNRFAPHQLGFVTDYGMESAAEDQAEIFACLMQAKHHRLVTQWQDNDESLRGKVRVIKTFVAAYDPEMDEEYWRPWSGASKREVQGVGQPGGRMESERFSSPR